MKPLPPLLQALWKPAALILATGLLMGWSSGCFHEKVQPGTVENNSGQPVPADAALVTVVEEQVAPAVEIVGSAVSGRKISLSARIGGYVNDVLVNAGDKVAAGQVLMTLDDREIREQLAAAEANLKQADAEYKRQRQLFERTATTEQALTAAESAFNAAKAQVDRVRIMRSYSQVQSPIDGIVTERQVESGDLANPGSLLLSVYDPGNMRLEAAVPVRLVHKFTLGSEVDIRLEYPARRLKGVVTEIVSEVDERSRTQRVKIQLPAGERDILPGAFGRIGIQESLRPAILVPAASIYRMGQLELVQVVQDGRAFRRMVKTGATYNQRVEILGGVKAGERILATPAAGG